MFNWGSSKKEEKAAEKSEEEQKEHARNQRLRKLQTSDTPMKKEAAPAKKVEVSQPTSQIKSSQPVLQPKAADVDMTKMAQTFS